MKSSFATVDLCGNTHRPLCKQVSAYLAAIGFGAATGARTLLEDIAQAEALQSRHNLLLAAFDGAGYRQCICKRHVVGNRAVADARDPQSTTSRGTRRKKIRSNARVHLPQRSRHDDGCRSATHGGDACEGIPKCKGKPAQVRVRHQELLQRVVRHQGHVIVNRCITGIRDVELPLKVDGGQQRSFAQRVAEYDLFRLRMGG